MDLSSKDLNHYVAQLLNVEKNTWQIMASLIPMISMLSFVHIDVLG